MNLLLYKENTMETTLQAFHIGYTSSSWNCKTYANDAPTDLVIDESWFSKTREEPIREIYCNKKVSLKVNC